MLDTILALAFMVFSLGFFIFSVNIVRNDDTTQWERRIMEMREFGVQDKDRRSAKHRR